MSIDPGIEGARAARDARFEAGMAPDAPVDDLLVAIEGTGRADVAILELPQHLAGACVSERGRAFLFVNQADAAPRQRFTLAHEFGHAQLRHGTVLDSGEAIDGRVRTPKERMANEFAAEFLTPEPALRAWLNAHAEGKFELETLVRLAAAFGVSAQSMRYRLQNTGILGQAHGDRALIAALDDAIGKGQHYGVPYRLGVSEKHDSISAIKQAGRPRVPAEMHRSGLKGYEQGILTIERLAAGLRRPVSELEAELRDQGVHPPTPPAPDSIDDPELDDELDALLGDDAGG